MTLRQPPYGIGAKSSGYIRQMNKHASKPSSADGFSFCPERCGLYANRRAGDRMNKKKGWII